MLFHKRRWAHIRKLRILPVADFWLRLSQPRRSTKSQLFPWKVPSIRLRLSSFVKAIASTSGSAWDFLSRGCMRRSQIGAFRESFRASSQMGAWEIHCRPWGTIEAITRTSALEYFTSLPLITVPRPMQRLFGNTELVSINSMENRCYWSGV